MAYKIVNDDSLTSVANAIRTKGSISGTLVFPSGFVSAIQNLPSGGNDALVITLTDSAAVSETYGYHWTPDCSYNDYYEAVIQQRPIGLKVNCTISGDAYARRINNSENQLEYVIVEVVEDANYNAIGLANKYYQFKYSGVTLVNEFFTPLPWDADAVTSDVASGKIFYTSNGRQVGTATLGSNDFIITASKDGQDNFTIDKTFAEIKSAYQDGKRLVVCSADYIVGYYEYVDTGTPSDDYFYIGVFSRTAHDLVELCYNYYSSSVIPEVYNTYYCPYGNATPSDVASGKTFINGSGRQTGTATPPSGTYSITSNGIYNIVSFASVDVNVSGGGGDNHDVEDAIINRTISGAYENSRVTQIGTYAFASCLSLTTISFPSVTSIGSSAFYYCRSLTTISFPNATLVEPHAFRGCAHLTTVSFPNVTSVGSYAFASCSSLTTASFPNMISVGSYAFAYCSNLTTISFPNVTSVGSSAFRGCSCLTTISFPNATLVGDYAFYSCTSLTTVNFPSVTSIGSSAFHYCTKLESFYILASSMATLGASAFIATPMSLSSYLGYFGSIYVPASLVDTYKSATNWSEYSDRITSYTG